MGQVVANVGEAAGLTAYGGHVVWSQRDPATGRWQLRQWHAGHVSRLAVSERGVVHIRIGMATEQPVHRALEPPPAVEDAPADEVKFDILKQGLGDLRNQMLKASEEPITLTMKPPTKVSGTVVDAATSQPVKEFKVIQGIGWDKRQQVSWQRDRGEIAPGRFVACHLRQDGNMARLG